jgi:hypothetical protein
MVNKQEQMMEKGAAIHDVQLAQVFNTLWQFIREHGTTIKQQPGLGGMWTPEGMWELDGVRATMSDGGYGSQIRAEGFSAWMQYSGGAAEHTVHFSEGVRDDLVALAVKVSKAKFAADDNLEHTED